jgi:hypothetical protein
VVILEVGRRIRKDQFVAVALAQIASKEVVEEGSRPDYDLLFP